MIVFTEDSLVSVILEASSLEGGARYASHIDEKGDLACLPYQFCFGLDMLAMSVIKETSYGD